MPTLSVYSEEVTRDLSIVGTIISMYGLWQAVARYPMGIVSDIIGKRKPFILVGFALSAVGAFVMMRATGAAGLIIGRGITGPFGGGVGVDRGGVRESVSTRTGSTYDRDDEYRQCCWPHDGDRYQWHS